MTRTGAFAALLLGAAALVAGTTIALVPGLVDTLARPPAIVRAGLVGVSIVLGLGLLVRAVGRLEAAGGGLRGELTPAEIGTMVRGIRLVFLAVAAFAAASGWALGHPLPIVLALIVAGVDVVETSLLLLVVAVRRG